MMPSNTIVQINNHHAFTTSLMIAEKFKKQHKDVLKAIRNVECSAEFNRRNFAPVTYLDAKNEERPAYEITRDGFMFLAMGFTGKEAAQWKEQFINAFNQMDALLTHYCKSENWHLLDALFDKRPQWKETVNLCREGYSNHSIAYRQNKHVSSVKSMKQRIAKAGIGLSTDLPLLH